MFKRTIKFLSAATVLLFCSCSTSYYYQVYSVKPVQDDILVSNNTIIYEDEECKISYDFWSYCGNAGFAFENKTYKNIYIDLSECFYIRNGYAYDYFQDRKYTSAVNTSVSKSSSSSFVYGSSSSSSKTNSLSLGNATVLPVGNALYGSGSKTSVSNTNRLSSSSANSYTIGSNVTVVKSSSVETPEQKIVVIPPHTTKVIEGFAICSSALSLCPMYPNSKQIESGDNVHSYTDKNYTPINFGNIIAYSFDKECKSLTRLVNDFYVEKISIYRDSDMYEDVYYRYSLDCPENKVIISKEEYRNIGFGQKITVGKVQSIKTAISTPSNFYIPFEKK